MARQPTKLSHAARHARRMQIAEAMLQGRPPGDVAAEFGISMVTVKQACQEHAVKWPRPQRSDRLYPTPQPSTWAIAKALLEGERIKPLADRFGVTLQRVSLIRTAMVNAGFTFPKK